MNKAKITEKKELTHDVFELHLEAENPFKFKAGQFVTLKIADNSPSPCFRAYSISSPPLNKNSFELCIKTIPNGRGSNWLNSLKKSDEVEFTGPSGNFIFNSDPSKKILFIATGTGIAPLKSIIENQLAKGNLQQMHLYFGLRHIKDIFYRDHFEKLSKNHKNFSFDLTLSQPENDSWKGHTGRVTALLEPLKLDPAKTEAYICGLNAMVEQVTEILKNKGLSEQSIHHEKYD